MTFEIIPFYNWEEYSRAVEEGTVDMAVGIVDDYEGTGTVSCALTVPYLSVPCLLYTYIPSIEERNDKDWYVTIPMGIITTEEVIITVCLEETPVLGAFMDGRVRDFHTYMKTRFILQVLYKNASLFLQYLRIIDKKSGVIEEKLHKSTKNRELIELLELEKSLVYFTTSLRSNEVVLEKLMRNEKIKKYPEDTDLLEDVIIENKQACLLYTSGRHKAMAYIVQNMTWPMVKELSLIHISMPFDRP